MNLLLSSFPEWCKEAEKLGEPLTGISNRIGLDRIWSILSDLFVNNTEKGERHNYDTVLMVKMLLSSNGTDYPIPRLNGRSGPDILHELPGIS